MNKPLVFAHRGASAQAPENTMAAFEKAIKMGADGIELDVQLSQDGHIVICHDEMLERTTNGKGWLKNYTYDELKGFDAGSWFNQQFKNEAIPSLKMLYDLVKHSSLVLNVELKNTFVPYGGLEEKLLVLTKEYKMEDRVIISSFNHYSLVHFNQLAPYMETAILYMEGLYQPWEYASRIGASSLHPYFRACYKEVVRGAHEADVEVRPFTVDDPNDLRKMINDGVDAIITNVPDRLLQMLKEY
ncbi:MAG: glycerophosphodiester phosphodiesterase [Bacilli bacterium]